MSWPMRKVDYKSAGCVAARIKNRFLLFDVLAPRVRAVTMAFVFDPNRAMVYDVCFVKDKAPAYFAGCSATVLKIVEKKNIPSDQYFYASYSKVNGWKLLAHDSTYKARKLLIKKEWVEENVPEFGNAKSTAMDLEPLPPLLHLEDHEKFKDVDGNLLDITVRGERDADKVFFKASDVEAAFGIEKIRNTLTNAGSAFVKGVHYKLFNRGLAQTLGQNLNKNVHVGRPDVLYLTYWGLTRILFTSHKDVAVHFQSWAIQVLFRAQMGTAEQRQELVSDVLGISPNAIRAFLDTSVGAMPAIYLFSLGKAKDLRNTLAIPDAIKDDDTVVKYGLTNDLKRRTGQHEKALGRLPGVDMVLTYHVYIDPLHLNAAESDIERYFKDTNWHLKHPKHQEIACVPGNMMTTVLHNEFKRLGAAYSGKLQELQTQINNVEKINTQLQKQVVSLEEHNRALREDFLERMREKEQLVKEKDKEKDLRIKEKDEMITLLRKLVESGRGK